MTYDAIVIGAGHNGLVCACYLAKAGHKVLVLERREVVGGACVTEEPWPGFKVSTAAYVNSLFRPQIVNDLRLRAYGFESLARNPSSFTPFLDGRSLTLGADRTENVAEIGKFSARDAERYPQYEAMLERVASVVEPTIDEPPPDPLNPSLNDLKVLWSLRERMKSRGTAEIVELLTGAARPILDRWFESEQLKGTLATDAIIGAFAAPSMPGTAYVLFHHVMGESGGARGVWSYVRGGMGGLTKALASAARDLGVEIRTQSAVTRIVVRDGSASGVVLANGDEFAAKQIASSADCNVTFLKLLEKDVLTPELRTAFESIDYSSASVKINLALDSLPQLASCSGTIHFCPDQDFIERAYDDAKYGEPSREPVVELTIPSSVDETLAPPGKYVASMFVQYAPYKLKQGAWTQALRNEFADRCFAVVEQYAPGFTSSVLHRQVLAPPDLEATFNLTGGNIFQGAMSLHQLFAFRPLAGFAHYRTPVKELYLCGSAAHPGGGVMGAAGRNAAYVMLRALQIRAATSFVSRTFSFTSRTSVPRA